MNDQILFHNHATKGAEQSCVFIFEIHLKVWHKIWFLILYWGLGLAVLRNTSFIFISILFLLIPNSFHLRYVRLFMFLSLLEDPLGSSPPDTISKSTIYRRYTWVPWNGRGTKTVPTEGMMVTESKEGQSGNYSDFRLKTWEGRAAVV